MSKDSSYLDPYRKAVADKGAGFEAQLWLSKDAQRTRFEVISESMGPNPGGEFGTIADLGCGQGDLLVYLSEIDHLPSHYIGIEGVDEMALHAQQRIDAMGIDHAVFQTHDFVADAALPAQLIKDAGVRCFVFSGSLNTLQMDHAQLVLRRFFDALVRAGEGRLIFNFLSDRHDADRTPAQSPAVRFDPAKMLDWALTQTPLVTLRHEYLAGHDATIVMDVHPA